MDYLRKIARPAAVAMAMAAGMAVQPAAAITCRGPDQRVGDDWLSTPYCQDNYIAQVARSSYGIRVSEREIRQNPSKKAEVCRYIGHDIRVNSYCQGDIEGGRRFRW
jgi:hypothetical protein